ncbi:MAG: PocR ligand-binding domain-containing protein [Candidatus Bathyarchaeota archaeon]|nr:PocR ligand-binding domain-containing protein [Candidatus Bathyarchaeota archaeon]
MSDFCSSNDKREAAKKQPRLRTALIIVLAAVSLAGLYAITTYSYPLFHTIVEVFSIVTAIAIFAIAWNTRHITDNNYLLFLGIALLFVAGLALFHTLAYKGMGVFPNVAGANLATQLWIAERYVFAFSFLIPLLLIKHRIKPRTVLISYSAFMVLLAFSFVFGFFPQAYDDATLTQTPFKIISEYIISLILLVTIGLLIKKKKEFDPSVYKMLLAAMALAIATEMAFTLYTDVYGIANIVGHMLNIVSFIFIYQALIETSLTKPYDSLFRNLKQSETALANHAQELTQVNERLEAEIAEREAIQETLRESEERLKLKLDSVLSPDVAIEEQDLANIIDVPSLQSTMNYLYNVTKMGFALIDLKGNVLVGTGWQDICTKFHRVNPQTCKNCVESDLELTNGLRKGEVRLYKCKNNMWDVATPLFIGDKHVGNVFFGQFFFDDETVDRDLFIAQAEKYGFKEEYLAAFDRIPRFSRQRINDLMIFYAYLSELISKLSYSNLKLAKSLYNQKELQAKLEDKAAEVEEYASQMEQLAEERARKLKDAERLSAIGATAGMVGHDIRNPLQAITGEMYLQRMTIESLPPSGAKQELLEGMKSIEDNLLYINKIVADLQDFAKPLNPKKEQVDVEKAVNDALSMVTIPKNIKITVTIDKDLPYLIGDSTMLKRVLTNLLQNGVQAMPKGGNLTVHAQLKNRYISLEIKDTGEGIPAEIQDKLFTPLMTTKAKGQGFGLAVVKRMTEAMNGTVTFESQPGQGTTFILQFPT